MCAWTTHTSLTLWEKWLPSTFLVPLNDCVRSIISSYTSVLLDSQRADYQFPSLGVGKEVQFTFAASVVDDDDDLIPGFHYASTPIKLSYLSKLSKSKMLFICLLIYYWSPSYEWAGSKVPLVKWLLYTLVTFRLIIPLIREIKYLESPCCIKRLFTNRLIYSYRI